MSMMPGRILVVPRTLAIGTSDECSGSPETGASQLARREQHRQPGIDAGEALLAVGGVHPYGS
jgi:hypothetical protein